MPSPSKRPKKPAAATKKPAGSPRGRTSKNSQPPPAEPGARTEPSNPPDPVLASALVESTSAAVERALTAVTSTPRRAVLIATVRQLAVGLDGADPADKPKISRELNARMDALMADANPVGEPPDWTETTGAEGTK